MNAEQERQFYKAKVYETKEEIRKFRLRMAKIFEQENLANDVYSLTIQLVPLNKRTGV